MRCTQIIGLNGEATAYLAKSCKMVPVRHCPHCGEVIDVDREMRVYEEARDAGMFDDGPDLHEYTLTSGQKVREVIQETPWSSGPCIFLCLEDENGTRLFEWPQEDIDNA